MQPLVSVIMPFFNTRPSFLCEAIDSVIQQSYPNWELMLIDDGSKNSCSQGASASLQLGIARSQGTYITFLESDDTWLPKKLEEQTALLGKQVEADALYGNTLYWYSWKGLTEDIDRDWMPSLGVPTNTLYRPPTLMSKFLSGKAAIPGTCSLIVRQEAIERIGGFENSFKVVYTDQVFYAKLTLNASIFVVDKCWDRYRQHDGSSCAIVEAAGLMQTARQSYLEWVEEYLKNNNFQNKDVWRALRQAKWRLQHPGLTRQFRRINRVVNFIRFKGGKL